MRQEVLEGEVLSLHGVIWDKPGDFILLLINYLSEFYHGEDFGFSELFDHK